MHSEIPIFKRCCFCLPLRPGLLMWAYLNLIYTLFWFTLTGVSYIHWMLNRHYEHTARIDFYVVSSVVSFLTSIIFTLTLIVAAHKKNIKLLHICFYLGLFCAITDTLILVGNVSFSLWTYWSYWFYMLRDLTLEVSRILIFTYLVLLVKSEELKLEKNHEFRFVNIAADAEEENRDHVEAKCTLTLENVKFQD